MTKRFRSSLLVALVPTVLSLSVVAASAATTLQVDKTAKLVARGAALSVTVVVTCDPSTMSPEPKPPAPSLSVQVTERVGRTVENGYGSASDVVCDGTPHTVPVWVTAQSRGFRRGVAFAKADIFSCDEFGCTGASDAREIRIVR